MAICGLLFSPVGDLADSPAFLPGITLERATQERGGDGELWRAPPPPARWRTSAKKHGVSMGIENYRVLGTESVRVRALLRGGSGATGVGQRSRSAVVIAEPLLLRRLHC